MSATSTSGRWPILLSGRGIKELKQLSKDKRTLDIVQKKLKELSHGQFTPDNYLLIRGTSENIPIYRASLSNDLRIVYQVDLIPDGQNQTDHQIIKVFSISSRARVDYAFWVKVSKYLARLGPDYRSRCIYRTTSHNSNGAACVPSTFPHQVYEPAATDKFYTTDETSLNELYDAVALEKFTPVTKLLYNAILADLEAALPMALNADERAIVRHQGNSVVIGRSGTGKTTALIYKIHANAQLPAISGDERPPRQLFVTHSKVLTQHIAADYAELVESSKIAQKSPEELVEIRKNNEKYWQRELVEFDNEVDLRDDLPDRFSKLQDSDFPVFISFDKLCSLLEADLFGNEGYGLNSTQSSTSDLITFNDFKRKYWPQFDSKLTRNLDPGLVFSEILGVIKSGGDTLRKEDYLSSLSHKKSPLLAAARRQVYGIFEAYVRQSRLWNQIDAADRTQKILNEYSKSPRWQVDYIFVDEVQDHLMVDVHLLQSLCSNPDGGYWCGDTAQTISVGSSFRIKELKTFIYEKMCSKQSDLSRKYRKTPAPFPTFELTVNFRSHEGIVRYAASLVELIYTLFPNAIDHMEPETAKIPGKAPLLFVGLADGESEFVHHLLDERPLGQIPLFGAQQAIIVRSESTAHSLARRLQKRCAVLTLLETKGLEFNDIIIYNFFSESEASTSTWRLLLGLSIRNEDGRIRYSKSKLSSSISPVLCSELKQLYVAVTRARHRCWLWDSGDTIDLMKVFWSSYGLITVSDSLEVLRSFAVPPKDLREWTHRGRSFFSSGLYSLAASCFARSGQDKEAAIADAYHHMSEAKHVEGDNTTIEAAYLIAANKMAHCAEKGDSSHSASILWYHAATCFEAARKITLASRSYRMGGFYDRAASVSFNSQDLDEVVQCMLQSPHTATWERIQDIALTHLWSNFGLDAIPAKGAVGQASQLIELCSSLLRLQETPLHQDIRLFAMIVKQTPISLSQLDDVFGDEDKNKDPNMLSMTLGYHHALKQNHWILADLSVLTIKYLRTWRTYSSCIQGIVNMANPSRVKSIQRLLGFPELGANSRSDGFIHIPVSSVLYSSAQGCMRVDAASERGNLVDANNVDRLIKQRLNELLETRLIGLHSDLYESHWTQPSWSATSPGSTFGDQLHAIALVFTALEAVRKTNIQQLSKLHDGIIRNLWLARLFNIVFPPTGACGNLLVLHHLQGRELKYTIYTWIRETLETLDPIEHKDLYITKLVFCLSLAYEMQIPDALHQSIRAPPRGPPSLLACVRSTRPDLFTAGLVQLFLRDSPRKITPAVFALQRIVRNNLAIDGTVLVHIVERITQEVLLAERAKVSRLGAGFSGLVITSSWARSLAIHSQHSQCVSDTESLGMLLQCVRHILRELYSGLPDRWKSLNNSPVKHSYRSLIIRLHWSLTLVAVNLHPARRELRLIFDILHQAKPIPERWASRNTTCSPDSAFPFNFAEISDQQSSLSALYQTIRHEEIIMLSDGSEFICPAKRSLARQIIEFRDLGDLCSQLSGFSFETKQFPVAPSQQRAIAETLFKPSFEEDRPFLGQQLIANEAAYRIQSLWRKCLARQRLREESEFDEEGMCYEQFRWLFLPLVKRKGEREHLYLRLLRGPCLSIVPALQTLVRELEEFLDPDNLNSSLRAPDLDSKDIAKVQKEIKRVQKLAQGYKEEAEALGKRVSTEWPPKDLKLKNPMHVKTFARNARDLFVKTKNSKILHDNKAFEDADELVQHRRNVIIEPSKPF